MRDFFKDVLPGVSLSDSAKIAVINFDCDNYSAPFSQSRLFLDFLYQLLWLKPNLESKRLLLNAAKVTADVFFNNLAKDNTQAVQMC